MDSKNKILEIHARWLHDNGYYKQFMHCMHQAKTYDPLDDRDWETLASIFFIVLILITLGC